MKAAYICWICLVIGLPFSLEGSNVGPQNQKQDLSSLTDYIQKVQFLEAQNTKLVSEMAALQSQLGQETSSIKQIYDLKLKEVREALVGINKEKNGLEVRLQSLTDQNTRFLKQLDDAKKWRSQDRETINKLNLKISELEAEIRMLRRTNDHLDTEIHRDKQAINRLNEELENLRLELNQETTQRLDAENRAQTLAEELEFLNRVHEQELREMAAAMDRTKEDREFWEAEIAKATQSIQKLYDSEIGTMKKELDKCMVTSRIKRS